MYAVKGPYWFGDSNVPATCYAWFSMRSERRVHGYAGVVGLKRTTRQALRACYTLVFKEKKETRGLRVFCVCEEKHDSKGRRACYA